MTQWAAANGLELRSRVRLARVRPASDHEARVLRIARRAPVFELECVRIVDGVPLSLDRSTLVLDYAPFLPEVSFEDTSLYGVLLGRAGIAPASNECTIRAAAADARVAKVLQISTGSPVLVMDELVSDQSGRPFELARLTNRGDVYGYRTT